MTMEVNPLWSLVLFPVIIAAFKGEIERVFESWRIYRDRPFDHDRDVDTAEVCLLVNPATGKASVCIINKYTFWSFRRRERGVDVSIVQDGAMSACDRHFNLLEWGDVAKMQLVRKLTPFEVNFLKAKGVM